MRYVSIDMETTGLDPQWCDVIEFGAVVEDTRVRVPVAELPTFHAYLVRESYRGQPYALSMHGQIFRRIATRESGFQYFRPEELGPRFRNWLIEVGGFENGTPVKITAAGKNFAAFDLPFLKRLDFWDDNVKVCHRCVDVGTLYLELTDTAVPSTEECMRRAGIEGTVAHTAVEDARLVVSLLRWKWGIA